jgi:hypothetical protein
MRRELAPAGHRIAASGGYNEQGPVPPVVGAIKDTGPWRFLGGALLVPRRPLQPFRAGFDSPALHFHSR